MNSKMAEALRMAVYMCAAKFEKEISTVNQFVRNAVGVDVHGWCISDFDTQVNRSGYIAWLRQNGFSYVLCADYFFVYLPKPKQEAVYISLPLWTNEQKRTTGMLQRLIIAYDSETTVLAWLECGERASSHVVYNTKLTETLCFRMEKDFDSSHVQAIVNTLVEHDNLHRLYKSEY